MRSPFYWFFGLVALSSVLLLQVHAVGGKGTDGNDTTERLVSVLVRPHSAILIIGSSNWCKEDEILQCAPIQRLSVLKQTLEAQHSPVMRIVFSWLFPFGPAWNSILGTFYISSFVAIYFIVFYILMMNSVPNFILAFIPAEINGDTLNTMTAFAVRLVHSSLAIIVDLWRRLAACFRTYFYI